MELNNEFYQECKSKLNLSNEQFCIKSSTTSSALTDYVESLSQDSSSKIQNQSDEFSLRLSESYIDETQESFKQKLVQEIIVISESSSEDSVIFYDQTCTKLASNIQHSESTNLNCESSDKSSKIALEEAVIETVEKVNSISKVLLKDNCVNEVLTLESYSESEVEKTKLNTSRLLQDTVTQSVTLSEQKKKEILIWLSTNFNSSKDDNSCSMGNTIPASRNSGFSSGNSSLERLEINFETPNNRDKFLKNNGLRNSKLNKEVQTEYGQLKNTDNSNSIEKDCLNVTSKVEIFHSDCKNKTQTNSRKKKDADVTSVDYQNNSNKNILDSNTSDFNNCTKDDRITKNSFNDITLIGASTGKKKLENHENISLTNDDESELSSIDLGLSNKKNQTFEIQVNRKKSRDTINDCADILENLYGTDWKNKASKLISASEPRKQIKKFFNEVQTDKKINTNKTSVINQSFNSNSKINQEIKNNGPSVSKKFNNIQQSFLNDCSSAESSPDCSYYTALSNPLAPFQNDKFTIKTLSTININKTDKLNTRDFEFDLAKQKFRNNQRKLSFSSSTGSSTSEFDPEDVVFPKKIIKNSKVDKHDKLEIVKGTTVKNPNKIVRKSFLASLSKDVPLEEADFKAMVYRVKYNTLKEELCKVLYNLFNEKIFDNRLPIDMSLEWSVRLPCTAGMCYNTQSMKTFGKISRSSRIVLASKVLDSPDRLRDTLIHEMCHAATWLINNVSDGHGCFWRAWAAKATQVFPELPSISRCHNYKIQTKFTYKCSLCGYSIGRHSKSLDLNKKRCGYCHGTFELLINKVTNTGKVQKKVIKQSKEPTGFALFVKENYSAVKQNKPMKHGEIMKVLAQQFSEVKISQKAQ